MQKILVLLVVAVVMLVMNLKSSGLFATFTFVSMFGALLGALWLVGEWVFFA